MTSPASLTLSLPIISYSHQGSTFDEHVEILLRRRLTKLIPNNSSSLKLTSRRWNLTELIG